MHIEIVGAVKNLILLHIVGGKECCNTRLELLQLHIISTGITKPKFKQRLSLCHLLHKCFRYIKLEHTGVILHIHDTADGIGLLSVSKIHFYGLPDFCGDFKIIKKCPFYQNFIGSLRKCPSKGRLLTQFHPVGIRILHSQNAVTIAGGTVILGKAPAFHFRAVFQSFNRITVTIHHNRLILSPNVRLQFSVTSRSCTKNRCHQSGCQSNRYDHKQVAPLICLNTS